MKLHQRLAEARARLVAAGIRPATALIDADLYARSILGWDRARLLTEQHSAVPPGLEPRFSEWIARRERREPSAYIVGVREFWGLEMVVTPAVLIPRPETEFIVEEALRLLAPALEARVADIGTGSGCVAVALASECPHCRIVASDVSPEALEVARENANRHGVAGRIAFVATSYLDGVEGNFDVITANPPYVKDGDKQSLSPDVGYEPDVALFGGAEGLRDISGVLDTASERLTPGGWLVMEFGYGQDPDVETMVAARPGLRLERTRQDLQGIPRTAIIQRRMNDCLFCKVIAGQIPAAIVYQDDALVAFKDINPQAPLHVLIVPRKHIATLGELSPEDDALVGAMHRRAAALAKEHGYDERGYRTVFNTNREAGQTVFHVHLHLLAGRALSWPPG